MSTTRYQGSGNATMQKNILYHWVSILYNQFISL